MEAAGVSRTKRRRPRNPGFGWMRKYWLHLVLGAIFALGFLFAKLITRA